MGPRTVDRVPPLERVPPLPRLSLRSILGLAVVVILAYLTALGFEPEGTRGATHRWLEDRHDRGIYFKRSQWYPRHELPYRDVFSEYPTVATLAFAAPQVLPGGAHLKAGSYRLRWSMLMAAVLLGTIALIAAFRRSIGARGEVALLLLLPSTLYFSLMRFDILCVALVCASLWAFKHGRYVLAHVVLALATHTKWYPAVLFPVYFAYHWSSGPPLAWRPRELLRSPALRYGGVYVCTAGAITLASILVFTWRGFLVPYRFHAGRGGQFINLYVLAEQARGALGIGRQGRGLMNLAFGCLQLSIVPILLLKPVRTMADVFRMAVLAIFLFIAFARIDSPQWLLWYVAPVLMIARRPATLCVAGALCIWNYLVFPIGYDAYAHQLHAAGFSSLVLVKDALAVLLVALVFRESSHSPMSMPSGATKMALPFARDSRP
jgi:hypothetical protein